VDECGSHDAPGLLPEISKHQSNEKGPESIRPTKTKVSKKGIKGIQDMGEAENQGHDDDSPAPLHSQKAKGAAKGDIKPRLEVTPEKNFLPKTDKDEMIQETEDTPSGDCAGRQGSGGEQKQSAESDAISQARLFSQEATQNKQQSQVYWR